MNMNMNINEIQKIVSGLTESKFETLQIDITLFENGSKKGYADYNKYIRKNVKNKCGVYLFFDPKKHTPIYIGMAGKLNENGQPGKQKLDERLTNAEREGIATKKWVYNLMKDYKFEQLYIYVFYANDKIPAAYLEALLLFEFYKIYNIIPIKNSEF